MTSPRSSQKDTRYTASQMDSARTKVGLFRLQTVITTAIVAVLALIFVWPFLTLLGSTFKSIDAGLRAPLWPIPSKISFTFYELTFGEKYGFPSYIWNSVKVAVLSTVLSSFTCTLTGYALAKLRFPGRDFLFSLIIGVMLLPTTTMLVPQYVVMRDLGLTNTHWGLILPAVGGGAFGIFLMRQFIMTLPRELDEAAIADGASYFRIFWNIIVPLSKPAGHCHAQPTTSSGCLRLTCCLDCISDRGYGAVGTLRLQPTIFYIHSRRCNKGLRIHRKTNSLKP